MKYQFFHEREKQCSEVIALLLIYQIIKASRKKRN